MLKLKIKKHNKANAKDVGGVPWTTGYLKAYQNPNSKIQTLNSDPKGITLIALIITIIVMLILVAVTVNVALNGGLFNKAKTAVQQTQKEADREQLLSAVVGAMNDKGMVDYTKLDENVKGLNWTGGNGTYTSPKGNTFTVDETGKITYVENENEQTGELPSEEDLNLLRKYFLGSEETGRPLDEIMISDILSGDGYGKSPFISEEDTIENASQTIKLGGTYEDGYDFGFFIRYNSVVYKVECGYTVTGYETEEYNTVNIVPTYVQNDNDMLGKYVEYDGKKWIVLYNDTTNGIQLISANTLEANEVTLGCKDSQIDWDTLNIKDEELADVNNNKVIDEGMEKAIYSYNHAIENLNKKCEELITDKSKLDKDDDGNYKIRSVGSNPNNPNGVNYNFFDDDNLSRDKA